LWGRPPVTDLTTLLRSLSLHNPTRPSFRSVPNSERRRPVCRGSWWSFRRTGQSAPAGCRPLREMRMQGSLHLFCRGFRRIVRPLGHVRINIFLYARNASHSSRKRGEDIPSLHKREDRLASRGWTSSRERATLPEKLAEEEGSTCSAAWEQHQPNARG